MKNAIFGIISLFVIIASSFATDDKLEVLNLVMLFDDKIEEQAEDLKKMSAEKVADVHMISFFLVPEGNPPIDKISVYENRYKRLRKAIGDADCKTGIILQATMGHGYALEVPHPYQQLVSLDTKNPRMKINTSNIVCPLDERFQKYILACVKRVAALKPSVMMVDDDFRLVGGRYACVCPLHLAKLKADYGYDLTIDQLKAHLAGTSELDKKISDAAWKVNEDSLVGLAKKIRATIDSVDENIHCQMCGSPFDMGYDGKIARALAAKNKPSTLRIGNARYGNRQYRDLYHTACRFAVQKMIANADRTYAELDTFPRNRYFASARTLHAGFVVSILEGCSGAKYWPNRFVDYEPDSGVAFKKILSENRLAYDSLYKEIKGMRHLGVADIIIPTFKTHRKDQNILLGGNFYWASLNGIIGLPVSYINATKIDRPVFLRTESAKLLDTPTLEKILSIGAVLDSGAIMEIQKRGLSSLLGVKAKPWNPRQKITRERFRENAGKGAGKVIEYTEGAIEIIPTSNKVEIFSDFIHIPYTYGDKKLAKTLSPACLYFENDKGGKIVMFASKPTGPAHFNESRKDLYIRLLNRLSPMGLWYAEDAECYFKAGKLANGAYFACLTNLAADPLDEFTLGTTENFTRGEFLDKDGKWKPIVADFSKKGEIKIKNLRAEIFYPVMMRFW